MKYNCCVKYREDYYKLHKSYNCSCSNCRCTSCYSGDGSTSRGSHFGSDSCECSIESIMMNPAFMRGTASIHVVVMHILIRHVMYKVWVSKSMLLQANMKQLQ